MPNHTCTSVAIILKPVFVFPPQVDHHEPALPQRHHVAMHDGLGLRLGFFLPLDFLFLHVVMGLHVANHYVPELPLSTTLSAMGYLFDPPRARSSTSADSKGARTNPRCMEGRVLQPLDKSTSVHGCTTAPETSTKIQ